MKILFIDATGAGFASPIEVAEGTTVGTLFLERIGIFTVASYLSSWRMSVLVIAFLAMLFTPSDPYSMLLMMLPLIGLYFFGIMLCRWMPRRTGEFIDAVE